LRVVLRSFPTLRSSDLIGSYVLADYQKVTTVSIPTFSVSVWQRDGIRIAGADVYLFHGNGTTSLHAETDKDGLAKLIQPSDEITDRMSTPKNSKQGNMA